MIANEGRRVEGAIPSKLSHVHASRTSRDTACLTTLSAKTRLTAINCEPHPVSRSSGLGRLAASKVANLNPVDGGSNP